MREQLIEKLEEPEIKSHVYDYTFVVERDAMFHIPTGRTHLYIKLHETTPKRVIQTLTTYFRDEQNLKVNDIQYPYYTILRVEVAPFSKEWLAGAPK